MLMPIDTNHQRIETIFWVPVGEGQNGTTYFDVCSSEHFSFHLQYQQLLFILQYLSDKAVLLNTQKVCPICLYSFFT